MGTEVGLFFYFFLNNRVLELRNTARSFLSWRCSSNSNTRTSPTRILLISVNIVDIHSITVRLRPAGSSASESGLSIFAHVHIIDFPARGHHIHSHTHHYMLVRPTAARHSISAIYRPLW